MDTCSRPANTPSGASTRRSCATGSPARPRMSRRGGEPGETDDEPQASPRPARDPRPARAAARPLPPVGQHPRRTGAARGVATLRADPLADPARPTWDIGRAATPGLAGPRATGHDRAADE